MNRHCLQFALLLTAALALRAQSATRTLTFDEHHQADVNRNPSGVNFNIAPLGGGTTFHCGERIIVNLTIRAPRGSNYECSYQGSQDDFETYCVDKADGAVDPLPYSFPALSITKPGGLMADLSLRSGQCKFGEDVNTRFAFDKPGVYRIYARTSRLWKDVNNANDAHTEIIVASNILTITILPDGDWADRRLASAIYGPDNTIGQTPQQPVSIPSDVYPLSERISIIRYLRTPKAAHVLVRLFCGDQFGKLHQQMDDWLMYATSGAVEESPYRKIVLDDLAHWINRPDTAVDRERLLLYASVLFRSRHATVPEFRYRSFSARRSDVNLSLCQARDLLRRSLSRKTGKAKQVSSDTLSGWYLM